MLHFSDIYYFIEIFKASSFHYSVDIILGPSLLIMLKLYTFAVPTTISYEDQCKRKEQRNPIYSAAAESVMFSLGYSKTKVRNAINIYIERTGRF